METSEESSKNKKDLERFIKFFVIKSVQVIVQSRISGNRKVKTDCRLPNNSSLNQHHSSSEWFNMEISDDCGILSKTHTALLNSSKNFKLEIEIYLETDNMKLLLEIWLLSIKQDENNTTRDVYNVYNRMSLMLKSLIAVSRVTPAYKIARRVNNEFRISWEIKQGDLGDTLPSVFQAKDNFEEEFAIKRLLGEEFKRSYLGEVLLPPQPSESKIGVELLYRTKMETTLNETNMLIKSDHYGDEIFMEKLSTKESVKPAFASSFDENNVIEFGKIDDDFISQVPFGKLLLLNNNHNKKKTDECCQELLLEEDQEIDHFVVVKSQHENKSLTLPSLPFALGSTTNTDSGENYDLLNLFEEFRVAPTTLGSWSKPMEEEPRKVLDNFETDLKIYDDFVTKLLN